MKLAFISFGDQCCTNSAHLQRTRQLTPLNAQPESAVISLREFDPTVRRCLLLTYVGEATNDIFDTLSNTGTHSTRLSHSLNAYFDPVYNKDMNIYDFRQIKQEPRETSTAG